MCLYPQYETEGIETKSSKEGWRVWIQKDAEQVCYLYIYVFTEVTSWKVIHLVSYGPYFIIIIIIIINL